MLRRTPLRLTAVSLAVAVGGFAASPALAAGSEATGTATAFQATVGGMPTDAGSYSATNDGTGETTSGTNKPVLSVAGGQNTLNIGTLAQDATTSAKGGRISSAACSGIAGQGATLVAAGDGSCLQGGDALSLGAGSLDLQDATLLSDSQITDMLPADVKSTLGLNGVPGLSDVLATITTQLKAGLATLGDPALTLHTDALQSSCTARPGDADGTADLANASLSARLGNQSVTLLNVPAHPGPNTQLTSADGFTKTVTDSLSEGLSTSLGGQGAALQPVIDAIKTNLIDAAVTQFGSQLDAGLQQLISATANKQVRPDKDSIEVTALSVRLLPAAAATPIGFDAADFDIAQSTCSAGTFQVDAPVVASTPKATPDKVAGVPTAVDSGLSGDEGSSSPFLPVVGGLMLLAGAGIGVRRVLRPRG